MPLLRAGIPALLLCLLVLLPQAHAFGAGNIASISALEGKNWRHGDIEDVLKTIAFIHGHKWTSTMIKRVYFGNWLRDYSQAMDVGTLKNLQADTIRVLVWVLSFLTFGFATGEFEVTSERLGVYRPEEHIDNPKDYADNEDARKFDERLRGPIRQVELDIDMDTGMKNYIANERGDWATSAAYIKFSLQRSIHFGRMYTHGESKGKEEDLCEALRCLGQGLHTLEDFAAHTNYCELSLREMGFHNVFSHTGAATQMNIRGRQVFPLVTGTFGMVDFFHSVLGEATDHFTQSEVNEMDIALGDAENNSQSNGSLNALTSLLGKIPGTRDLVTEAEHLRQISDAQEASNRSMGSHMGYARSGGSGEQSRASPQPPTDGSSPSHGLPGMPDIKPQETVNKIYPILAFRDKVVRKLNAIIEKIPGLEAIIDKISETLTVFIMSLLAPFVRPLINAASKSLQTGSSGVIAASGKHQYEPWTDPHCTDPTHSLLSKDHFANILNEPAGQVATAIVKYVAPRVLYAWQHIDVPEHEVLNDCMSVFHHPAFRDMNNEAHRTMFEAVNHWVQSREDRGANLNDVLSAEGVRAGRNTGGVPHTHGGGQGGFAALGGNAHGYGQGQAHSSGGLGGLSSFLGGQHGSQQQSQHGSGGLGGLSSFLGGSQQQSQHGSSGGLGGLSSFLQGQQHSGSQQSQSYSSGGLGGFSSFLQGQQHSGSQQSQSHGSGVPWDKISHLPIPGMSKVNQLHQMQSTFSNFMPGRRGLDEDESVPGNGAPSHQDQHGYYEQQGGSHSGY